jgi:hypothetical protein
MLNPAEDALFCTMQPSEQRHSIQVMQRLWDKGYQQPDLLVAALLHDVGKTRLPLTPWERTFIVLVKALFPVRAQKWGRLPVGQAGWRKALVVSYHHAAWGAEMAAQVCSSPTTISLIRRHQDPADLFPTNEEDFLLALLQAADDAN